MARRRRSFDDDDDDDDEWMAHIPRRVGLTRSQTGTKNNAHGPASRTRSSKKIKLDEVASIQGGEESRFEDYQPRFGDLRSNPWIPEKRVLELILDILQRRDTHEIFAEPVDPEEVEDYYDIIKQPMDFGTMRAKLHEGLYKNLQQFESDVFLITRNAMHFNPSGTIYFRQARVINELAMEVFRVLRERPESFESEFSESRRRNARRSRGDRARPKATRDAKSVPFSSNIRRSRQGYSCPTFCPDARDLKVPYWGCGDHRGSIFTEAERRYTYRPWLSFDEDETISNRKQLEHVIQKDIGYTKSLMSFVKDLGPVVQSFARKKLSESFPIQNCQSFNGRDSPIASPKQHNFVNHIHGQPALRPITSDNIFSDGEMATWSIKQEAVAILSASSLLARASGSSTGSVGLTSVGNGSTKVTDRSPEFWSESDRCNSSSNSSLVFGFPCVKSRLGGQTNAFERLALLQRSSGSELSFFSATFE